MRALPRVLWVFGTTMMASLVGLGAAHGNGRFPIADQLVVDPVDASHLVLRTTYGILETSNAGKSWSWICELGIGYGGTQDPAIGIHADGTVLAGVFEGLAVSHDRGCSWTFAGAPLAGEYLIDVSVQKDDPSRGLAITSTGAGSNGFHVIVAETLDNGATWKQAGTAIMNDFLALTVDAAPSLPSRIYASGLVGKTFVSAIERSDDRGVTWTRYYLDPTWAKDVPFIAAVDPQNPDRVYLRLSGDPIDRLLVSEDGAMTFTEKYTAVEDLLGFALSPDGSRVAIGGPKDGLLVASTADLVFQKQNALYTRCLTWTPAGLYACANQFVDNFTVGLSQDEGVTFTDIYDLPDICPIECPAGGTAPAACVSTWPAVAATLGIPPEACGGSAASSSSSASSGGASSGGGGGDSSACGCRIEAKGAKGEGWGAAALGAITALGASLRRRMRDRRRGASRDSVAG